MAMPSHQFKQEAETNEKIASNVKDLGVEFTLLEPADVNGPKQSPLYTWLKENTSSDDITWNFGTYCKESLCAASISKSLPVLTAIFSSRGSIGKPSVSTRWGEPGEP